MNSFLRLIVIFLCLIVFSNGAAVDSGIHDHGNDSSLHDHESDYNNTLGPLYPPPPPPPPRGHPEHRPPPPPPHKSHPRSGQVPHGGSITPHGAEHNLEHRPEAQHGLAPPPKPHEMDNHGHEPVNTTLTCNCLIGSSGQNFTRIPLNTSILEGSLGERCDPFARSSCRRQCIEMANNATYFLDTKTVSVNGTRSQNSNGVQLQRFLCELYKQQETDVAVVISSVLTCHQSSDHFQFDSQRTDMTAMSPHDSTACNSTSPSSSVSSGQPKTTSTTNPKR